MIQLHLKIELSNENQKESFSFGKAKVSEKKIKAKIIELLNRFPISNNIEFNIGY